MKAIAVIAADTHIDDVIWLTYPEVRGDAHFAMSCVVDKVFHYDADLIMAGDNLENLPSMNPTSEMMLNTYKQLQRVTKGGKKAYYVQGQHCKADPPWMVMFNAVHLHNKVYRLGPFSVTGLDYTLANDLEEACKALARTDVVVCHQRWGDLLPGPATSDGFISDLLSDYNLVITGDLHKFVLKRIRSSGTRILSPGATHLRAASEPLKHYVSVLYEDGSIKRSKLRGRPMLRMTLDSEHDLNDLLEDRDTIVGNLKEVASRRQLPPQVCHPLVILRTNGSDASILKAAEEVLSPFVHVYRLPANRQKMLRDKIVPAGVDSEELLAASYVDEFVDPDTPASQILKRLLSVKDWVEELKLIREERT